MKKCAFLILFFVSALSYAAAEETMDVPEETIDVPVEISEKECPICLSQMTLDEFKKNEIMNGNKIHDNCFAKRLSPS